MTLTVLVVGVVWALGAALFSRYVEGLADAAAVAAVALDKAGDAQGYASGIAVWYALDVARKHAWA